jgi:hypothetical protein
LPRFRDPQRVAQLNRSARKSRAAMMSSKLMRARSFNQVVVPTTPNSVTNPMASRRIVDRTTKRMVTGMAWNLAPHKLRRSCAPQDSFEPGSQGICALTRRGDRSPRSTRARGSGRARHIVGSGYRMISEAWTTAPM